MLAVLLVAGVRGVLLGGDDDDPAEGDTARSGPASSTTSRETPDGSSTTRTTPDPTSNGGFLDGVHTVGEDVDAGRYIATDPTSAGCTWARLSDAAGEHVVAEQMQVDNQAIVDILATDMAFRSAGCGRWEPYEAGTGAPVTRFEDGDYVVGDQIEPGAYTAESGQLGCTWTRASAFEFTLQEIVADGGPLTGNIPTVDLVAGERFSSRSCGRWIKIG